MIYLNEGCVGTNCHSDIFKKIKYDIHLNHECQISAEDHVVNKKMYTGRMKYILAKFAKAW